MIISSKGIEFIKSWESFKPKAYKDQAGIWTIGYGTTLYFSGRLVKQFDEMTLEDATRYLLIECDGISAKISNWLKVTIQRHEFDALISLSYNIGTYGFKGSTLLKELNRELPIIENYFTRWNKIHVDGKLVPSKGLTRRRKSEFTLFDKANYNGNITSARSKFS